MKKQIWYDYNGIEHQLQELEIGKMTSLYGFDQRNFFFAKNNKEIEYCGRDQNAIYIIRKE